MAIEPLRGREPWHTAAQLLLDESGCIVSKWRVPSTGCAYTTSPDWLIEAPQPTSALRFAVLAHEVGHQWLHRSRGTRWIEETEAWAYALLQFHRLGLELPDDVLERANRSVSYALRKAIRRGAEIETGPFPLHQIQRAIDRIATRLNVETFELPSAPLDPTRSSRFVTPEEVNA